MAYERLFQKGRIGTLEIKNRVVMPAMGVSLAEPDGRANEHIIRYYEERAKGGVGLIITEITRVEPEFGTAVPNQLGAYEGYQIPHLERLTERVHKYGTKIFMQLQHPGRENTSTMIGGRQIVAPSPVMCKVTQEMPRELTTEECTNIMKAFVKGAVIAKNAGFDGVELHAAHGYLLNEFLSPYTNKRTDRYGGSFSNRLRILEEMITAIRHLCGPEFAISVRISGDEFVEGGLHLEDTIQIALNLEAFGIDVINVSAGIYETATTIIEPASYPQGWKKHLGTAIKKAVKIPVIAANNIKDPEIADQLLEEEACDFIAIGRASLADPEWTKKAKEGRADEINKCIGCLYCFKRLSGGNHISCAVNPRCGREVEYSNLEKNGEGKTIAVIGGGPAGMMASLTLKERGFEPVLYEQASELGGQLNIADKPILKEKLTAYKDSLITRVMHAGIDVRLNTKATPDMVKELHPAGVFLAIGGKPAIPPIPGVDQPSVMTAEEVLLKKKIPSGKVAIIGGGITGIETADTLSAAGMDVTIIEMMPQIGAGLYRSVQKDFLMRLEKNHVKIQTRSQLLRINDQHLTLINTRTNECSVLEADTVVLALGVKPDNMVKEQFEAAFDDCIVLGDAVKSGRIAEATFDGYGRAYTF